MLWLALTAKHAGQRPSKLAGLIDLFGEDDPGCLDFDLTCSLRLLYFDNQRDENFAKQVGYEVAKATWGSKDEEEVVEYA